VDSSNGSNATEAGSIFIREGTPLPPSQPLESEPYRSGWRLVRGLDADRLGRKLQGTGWTFFCLAGRMRGTAFGRGKQQGTQNALGRMLSKLKLDKFNALEITDVVSKRFLGMPYVTVFARSRHIQDGVFLA